MKIKLILTQNQFYEFFIMIFCIINIKVKTETE